MEIAHKKLTGDEWATIEVPIPPNEKKILEMIKTSYQNINFKENENKSLFDILKMSELTPKMEVYIYTKYLKNEVDKIKTKIFKKIGIETGSLSKQKTKNETVKIKKADEIRLQNIDKRMKLDTNYKSNIYEFKLLNILALLSNSSLPEKELFTLNYGLKSNVANKNWLLVNELKEIIKLYVSKLNTTQSIKNVIYNADNILEKNTVLQEFDDIQLYDHQKRLFYLCKQTGPKLILYQAPTGTGKTVSPIGLATDNYLIFVCASKHVALQFAKSCISMEIPIGIAFGCRSSSDIRLHNYSAKEYVKNYKTGGIYKIDHSVGDKVRVLVSDVFSYIHAMNYLTSFRKPEEIIMYWDEPTITMDKELHDCHTILAENWQKNIIPNIVLSSATLPSISDIEPVINSFKTHFTSNNVHTIQTFETGKSIPIYSEENYVLLPHTIYKTKQDIRDSVDHILKHKSILRYFDIHEISRFIKYIVENDYLTGNRIQLLNNFDDMFDITLSEMKEYYINMLKNMESKLDEKRWEKMVNDYKREEIYASTKFVISDDAYTLTYGPTIYLADNVEQIAKFCIITAKIPVIKMEELEKIIGNNKMLQEDIKKIEKEYDDHVSKTTGMSDEKESRMTDVNTNDPVIKRLTYEIDKLKSKMQVANLDETYIPNTENHLHKYHHKDSEHNTFKCDIPERVVEEIMNLDVEANWKLLLLMGIGTFSNNINGKYLELMKKLALNQQLFMIIASTDFIYGTNYQFCHGYIAKDLTKSLTQEKCIQAMGRVGRGNKRQNYSVRLRDNSISDLLFKEEKVKMEAQNMNRLFC